MQGRLLSQARVSFSQTEVIMSNRPIIDFLRESRLLRKVLIVGALVAGVYFLGVKMDWWQLTIGG